MLKTTENGTIYESADDELVVQGGNVDKVTWHWWGVRKYACHNCAEDLAHAYEQIAIGTTGTAGIAVFFPPVGTGVAIASIFGTTRAALLANSIKYYNGKTDRGVIVDLRWIVTYKVSCQ